MIYIQFVFNFILPRFLIFSDEPKNEPFGVMTDHP